MLCERCGRAWPARSLISAAVPITCVAGLRTNLVAGIWSRAHARQPALPPMIASLTNLRSPALLRPVVQVFNLRSRGSQVGNLRHLLLVCFVALLAVAFPGCAHKRPPRPAFPPVPSSIGEVAIVNLAQRFVLIDIGRAKSLPPAGAELTAKNMNGQESARLRVTPERKPPFITADIVSGTPGREDKVYR